MGNFDNIGITDPNVLESSKAKKYLCKYQCDSLVMCIPGDKMELDHSNILSVEYLCDYECNINALLKVTCRVDIDQRLWILEHKKDISCKFDLNKVGCDLDMNGFVTGKEKCISGNFEIHFNDEDDSVDVALMRDRKKANEGKGEKQANIDVESWHESQNTLDVYLFEPKNLKASRHNYNKVFTETTLQDAVGCMLTESGHSRVLMSPFENHQKYKELVLPPHPVYKQLAYMDQYYGCCKKGLCIFYDIDCVYILNSDNSKVTAKRPKEWECTTIYIPEIDMAQPGNGMIRIPGENIYYPTISELDINPQNFAISQNVNLGSEARIVVTDSTIVDLTQADQSYINARNEFVTYVQEEYQNAEHVLRARMEENECILYINGENLDINAFTPNKIYQVVFKDPRKQEKFGTKLLYKLTYAYHYAKIESGHYMDTCHRIVLKKVSGPIREKPSPPPPRRRRTSTPAKSTVI